MISALAQIIALGDYVVMSGTGNKCAEFGICVTMKRGIILIAPLGKLIMQKNGEDIDYREDSTFFASDPILGDES